MLKSLFYLQKFPNWQNHHLKKHYGDDNTELFFAKTLAFILLSCASTMTIFSIYFLSVGPHYFSTATKIAMLPVFIFPVTAYIIAYQYLLDGQYKIARNIFVTFTIMAIIFAINMTGGFFNSIASPFLVVVPVMVFLLYGMRAGAFIAVTVPLYMVFQSIFLILTDLKLPDYTSMANPKLNTLSVNISLYLLVIAMVASYEYQRASLKKNLDEERRKLAALANHDTLTNLSNSRHFYTELSKQHLQAVKHNTRLTLLYIDLDRFKSVNDNFGHQVGDHVLVEIARRIRKCARKYGVVARIGGDEFAVLINGDISDQKIDQLKTALTNEIIQPTSIDDATHTVGASIGHAIFPDDCASVYELLKKADEAMYRNKKQNILDQAKQELDALPHNRPSKIVVA